MLEALIGLERRVKSDFQIALDFQGQNGSQVISNTGSGIASFAATAAGIYITNLDKVFGDTCLLSTGATNTALLSNDAFPGGSFNQEFYIGFYAKSRGNNTDPYRGFFHLGYQQGASANGITLLNDGLYMSNPGGTNWEVVALPGGPSTSAFEHLAVAKRITVDSHSYRLFRNGKVVGTLVRSPGHTYPGDRSARMEIGLNHAAGQCVNSFIANFRMSVGKHIHWEEFNPLDDYS